MGDHGDEDSMTEKNAHRAKRIARVANAFDSKITVPVLGLKVGYDALLGLVPGIGDAITSLAGGYIIIESARSGARKRVLLRMMVNTLLDSTLGAIPVIGDLFDILFRSNTRNAKLALREIDRQAAEEAKRVLVE